MSPKRTTDDASRRTSSTSTAATVAPALPSTTDPEVSTYSVDNTPTRPTTTKTVAEEEPPPEEEAGSTGSASSFTFDESAHVFDAVWKKFDIVKPSRKEKISASTRRSVKRTLNTYGYDGVTNADYNKMLSTRAVEVATKYMAKVESRSSKASTASAITHSDLLEERPVPLNKEADPASSSNVHSFVIIPEGEKERAYSGSTSPQRTMRPFQRPYPKDIAERVSLQRQRNEDLSKDGRSDIPDQEIVFDGAYPFDVRVDKGKQKEVKKEEDDNRASDLRTHTGSIGGIETRGKAPMSQPFLTGIYAATSDPLMGRAEIRRENLHTNEGQRKLRAEQEPVLGNYDRDRSRSRERASSFHVPRPPSPTRPLIAYESMYAKQQTARQGDAPQQRAASVFPLRTPYAGTQLHQERMVRGYSMPPTAPPPTVAQGILATERHHRDTMIDRLRGIIQDALGTALTYPEGYKPYLKNDNVKKYSGSPKYNELEEWLVMLVHKYALQRLGGDSANTDRVRLLMLIEYLEGTALTWFNNHVLNTKRTVVYWTFTDVIEHLYKRFVLPSTMHDARESFRNVKYSAQNGVQGFYDELVEHASNMAVYPDRHTLLEEFLKGIPHEMRTRCFKEFALNPESNDVDDFVSTALRIEHRNKVDAYYNSITRARPSVSSGGTKPKIGPPKHTAARVDSRFKPRFDSAKRPTNFKKCSGPNANKPPGKFVTPSAPKPAQAVPYKRYETSKPAKGSNNCYKCGEEGHFAYECKKEEKKKAFHRAAHTVADHMEEGDADDEEDSARDDPHHEPETENEDVGEAEPHDIEVPAGEEYEGHSHADYDSDFIYGMDVIPADTRENASTRGSYPPTVQTTLRIAAVEEKPITTVIPSRITAKNEDNLKKKYKVQYSERKRMRPTVHPHDKECLATWVKVGSLEAWTLWDSGSTTTGITPAFAEHAGIRMDTLEDPHVLQLGTVGSRSSIKYGADVNIQVAKVNTISYVDMANFDRYDMIIGTPWMKKHKVILDFAGNKVIVDGTPINAIKAREKDLDPRLRRHRTTDKKKDE